MDFVDVGRKTKSTKIMTGSANAAQQAHHIGPDFFWCALPGPSHFQSCKTFSTTTKQMI
jgi:hypothetical protein